MWTSTRRNRADHAAPSRGVGVAVALLACLGLAACTATESPSAAPTAEADTVRPFPESGVLDAGTYLVTGYPVPFEMTVPDGWRTYNGAELGRDDPDLPNEWNVFVSFWPIDTVQADACAWKGALVQIDPTAEAFVDAMTAQASTISTPPVEVMVGDYSGFEFDYAVESDVDLIDCDDGMFCLYSDSAETCNGRGFTSADLRMTYRAVDLNGGRAVIELGQSHESIDPALIEEARAVFDSIEFVGPDE
jgi:hypothetical protein